MLLHSYFAIRQAPLCGRALTSNILLLHESECDMVEIFHEQANLFLRARGCENKV